MLGFVESAIILSRAQFSEPNQERLKPDKTMGHGNNPETVTRKRAVVCPSCGAPQDNGSPSSGVQSFCRYCGSPLAFIGDVRKRTGPCQNHPDVPSAGTCKKCGGRFCENCLYVLREMRHEYVCEVCLDETKHRIRINRIFGALLTIVIAVAWIPLSTTQYVYPYLLFVAFYILEGLVGIFRPIEFPLLATKMHEFTPNPGSIYVKCLNCGSAYHYGPDKVEPNRTVVCQNCGRTINLEGEPDTDEQRFV